MMKESPTPLREHKERQERLAQGVTMVKTSPTPLQLIHRRVVAEKMDLVTMMKESPTPLQQRASSGDTRIVSRYNDEGIACWRYNDEDISYPVATTEATS